MCSSDLKTFPERNTMIEGLCNQDNCNCVSHQYYNLKTHTLKIMFWVGDSRDGETWLSLECNFQFELMGILDGFDVLSEAKGM